MCAEGRPDETAWGARIFSGSVSDAYLQRADIQRGYTVVVWRGRHVAEPMQLAPDEATAYWLELLRVAGALETHLRPGWPFPFPETEPPPMEAAVFDDDVRALRALLADRFSRS